MASTSRRNSDDQDRNMNVNNNGRGVHSGPPTQIKRPKHDVGHPSWLRDFHVEPVLKLTRPETPLVPCPIGAEWEFCVKRNLLSRMVDSGVIRIGGKLRYSRTCLPEGIITIFGVVCTCCHVTMSLPEFTSYVGGRYTAYNDIYVAPGFSFLEFLKVSWRKERPKIDAFVFTDSNENECETCGDGGTILYCDGCPLTFYLSCLCMQSVPDGLWYCMYCSCKFCGIGAGRVRSCSLCDDKFHKWCRQVNVADIDCGGLYFCGKICHEIYERLHAFLGVNNELGNGFALTLLRRIYLSFDAFDDNALKIECNSKLAVAYSVMAECLDPIVDTNSRVDMIRNVVYNCRPNFKRLNYGGFLTAILEKDDEVISVASLRVHGNKLAEMPFLRTRKIYRGQGMYGRLISSIESILSTLGVGELVTPANPALQTMTNVFGFKPLEESTRQIMKCMSMVVIPGTICFRNQSAYSRPMYSCTS